MSCIFCDIINGKAPAYVLFQDEYLIAFMDKYPLSKGHVLIVPVQHAEKMHLVNDEALARILPLAKRIANAMELKDYNILQNNGQIAHQAVMHVHFHIIPKREDEGLSLGWRVNHSISEKEIEQIATQIKNKLQEN